MLIYLDISAAVHRRAGLGRYAESLTRALVAAHPHGGAIGAILSSYEGA